VFIGGALVLLIVLPPGQQQNLYLFAAATA